MIKFFQDDNNNFSMGRLLSALLFVLISVIFSIAAIKAVQLKTEIGNNVMNACIWGWSIAIVGKGIQKFAEVMKK